MNMKLKKETKHTCVYETDALDASVSAVYVNKIWLATQPRESVNTQRWPQEIELEVKVLK